MVGSSDIPVIFALGCIARELVLSVHLPNPNDGVGQHLRQPGLVLHHPEAGQCKVCKSGVGHAQGQVRERRAEAIPTAPGSRPAFLLVESDQRRSGGVIPETRPQSTTLRWFAMRGRHMLMTGAVARSPSDGPASAASIARSSRSNSARNSGESIMIMFSQVRRTLQRPVGDPQ